MYDILQLNDMIVPELLDIAEQLDIENPKKLDKQELIYKILDKQAVMASEGKANNAEKPKRKRIVKAAASVTEEPVPMPEVASVPEEEKKPVKKAAAAKKEERPKRGRKKAEVEQPVQEELPLAEDVLP